MRALFYLKANMERFTLKKEFIEQYKSIKPPFGFNGLGELVYLRTYSRLKEDGTNESWYETVERVVNGSYSLQKEHILSFNLGWDERQAQESAQEMYDRMFYMKFIPSGRSLWAMGTSIITEKKLFAALNACSFVSTKDIDTEFTKPFEYMMDMEMLGVGKTKHFIIIYV
jgi:ribonucleoside-triphosphate reductase